MWVNLTKKLVVLVGTTIFCFSCSSKSTDILSRVECWERKFNTIAITGKDIEEVKTWLELQRLEYSVYEDNNIIYVNLETINAREWFCNFWQINSEIYFDNFDKVQYFEITTAGQCL